MARKRRMKAVVLDSTPALVRDYPVPALKPGEALVRVSLAGICNTDLELMRGYMGFSGVPGHEFVGRVEEVNGNGEGLLRKRVVGEINLACGVCPACRRGMRTHCERRSVLGILAKDGALAEHLTLPAGNLFEVPDDLADEEAVFTEPLAAAFEILEQVNISSSEKVLVLGDGKLGILIALVLMGTRADVTLVGKHGKKMDIAGRQGVRTVHLNDLAIESSYDIVVEATGSGAGFEDAFSLVRPRGTIVLKSTVARAREMNLTPVVVNEITLVGSRCGPFAPALRALAMGEVDVKPLITAVYGIDDVLEAFERAGEKDSLKVLVDFR
jgi:threonine dehydrogenase-like Zn-dependent dehydrogenase